MLAPLLRIIHDILHSQILLFAILAIASANLAPQDNCLTPQQDKELKEAVTGIQITLTATVTACKLGLINRHGFFLVVTQCVWQWTLRRLLRRTLLPSKSSSLLPPSCLPSIPYACLAINAEPRFLILRHRIVEDLVANLTKIAESACGTCRQITEVVNQTVVSLEETLSRIEPGWRNDTTWKVRKQGVF